MKCRYCEDFAPKSDEPIAAAAELRRHVEARHWRRHQAVRRTTAARLARAESFDRERRLLEDL